LANPADRDDRAPRNLFTCHSLADAAWPARYDSCVRQPARRRAWRHPNLARKSHLGLGLLVIGLFGVVACSSKPDAPASPAPPVAAASVVTTQAAAAVQASASSTV